MADARLSRTSLGRATLSPRAAGDTLADLGGCGTTVAPIEPHERGRLRVASPVAFRRALVAGAPRPRIFVVPCTLTYPLVLEASTLVDEYLRREGGPEDVDARDEFDRPRRWLDFLRSLRQLDERVHVRLSPPLDWLGNAVDDDGTSRDARGRPIDPAQYLLVDGRLGEDQDRDAGSTRRLAAAVLAAYRRGNTALPSSVTAFAIFDRLQRVRRPSNLFRFLRALDPDLGIPVSDLLVDITRILQQLERLEAAGAIHRASGLQTDAPRVLARALALFSTYHRSPIIERRGDHVHVGDARLLLYYRNRLEGYGLLDDEFTRATRGARRPGPGAGAARS